MLSVYMSKSTPNFCTCSLLMLPAAPFARWRPGSWKMFLTISTTNCESDAVSQSSFGRVVGRDASYLFTARAPEGLVEARVLVDVIGLRRAAGVDGQRVGEIARLQ